MNSVCIGPDPVRLKEFLFLVGGFVQEKLFGYATAIFSFLSRVISKALLALLDGSDHASEFLLCIVFQVYAALKRTQVQVINL